MPFLDLSARLSPSASEPLALQLARLLAMEIMAGRLAPGEAMPSSRILAQDLGLSRHVVMSTLRELEEEGWVESRPRSGMYVVNKPPTLLPKTWGAKTERTVIPQEPSFVISEKLRPVSSLASSVLDLSDGYPDARLAPKEAIARGYHRALQRHGDELLTKGESRGNHFLREQLAGHLRNARGLHAEAENLLITRSTTMSLTLIAQALTPEGGDIAVENPGDPRVREALGSTGANLHPLSVDKDGLVLEPLEELLAKRSIAMLHLTPRRHFPTTVPLAPFRQNTLMALARNRGFALVEEDPDAEFTWESPLRLPLAAQDPDGRVIHLGSLSQLLAPGLGLAYVVAPATLIDRLARLRQRMELQGDRVLEWALADLIRDGDLERHLTRGRKVLRERWDAFKQSLAENLGTTLEVQPCNGGLACWVRTPEDLDLVALTQACLRAGIRIHPGNYFDFHGSKLSGLRLGFAHLEAEEAQRALGILGREWATCGKVHHE